MPTATPSSSEFGIIDVWANNLEEEFHHIRKVVKKFNCVAMDTEFPGVVARPIGKFKNTTDYQYQVLRTNVDLLKIIQLGLSFMDENGNSPPQACTWQFNFRFSLTEDMFAQDSIDLLTTSGIQFKKHEEDGIEDFAFAELLMSSGIVLSNKVKWLSFHSGYDFGYLLKLLTFCNLPSDEQEFFELLGIFFPNVYDVKYLMKSCRNLKGGLQEVSEQLEITRIGPQHQAGSDSLLTGAAFFKMKEMFFEDNIDDTKYCGHLYGLGTSYVQNGGSEGESQLASGGSAGAYVSTSQSSQAPQGDNSSNSTKVTPLFGGTKVSGSSTSSNSTTPTPCSTATDCLTNPTSSSNSVITSNSLPSEDIEGSNS